MSETFHLAGKNTKNLTSLQKLLYNCVAALHNITKIQNLTPVFSTPSNHGSSCGIEPFPNSAVRRCCGYNTDKY